MIHDINIGIILFAVLLVLYMLWDSPRCSHDIEGFQESAINSEALQHIASVYNNKDLIVNNLKVTKDLTVNNLKVTSSFNLLPAGSIIAYNKDVAPEGWYLCDGKNGTPDLRGRFILGGGSDAGLTNRTLNETGGKENHTLTIDEMPPHSHGYQTIQYSSNTWRGGGSASGSYTVYAFQAPATLSAGGGKPHDNMPPFYVLTYIMKQ